MGKIFTTQDGKKIERVSRWIEIKYKEVTTRHSLYDYSDDGNLCYFTYKGRQYALGQFEKLVFPIFFEENGKTQYLCGNDCTEWYKPLLVEINDCCDGVRLYRNYEE